MLIPSFISGGGRQPLGVWVDGGDGLAVPGWVAAGNLRPGDVLRTATGTDVVVEGLRQGGGRAVVYTLSVAKDHTYFVGAAKVLVHNANACDAFFNPDWAENKFAQHETEFPGHDLYEYINEAERLANATDVEEVRAGQTVFDKTILEYRSETNDSIVRYNRQTNDLVIFDRVTGRINTFFKPKDRLNYFLRDIVGR